MAECMALRAEAACNHSLNRNLCFQVPPLLTCAAAQEPRATLFCTNHDSIAHSVSEQGALYFSGLGHEITMFIQ